MRVVPRLTISAILLGPASLLSVHCANRAVAIPECREIEAARCRASAACGAIEPADVDACVRFYRDQCLHGIAGPEAPSAKAQSTCVDAIEEAGRCAEDDQDATLASCQAGSTGSAGAGGLAPGDISICDFVAEPWDHPACDFLLPAPDGGEGGSK